MSNNLRKVLLAIFLCYLPGIMQAQYAISGTVSGSNGQPLEHVLLVLQNERDSSILQSRMTDSLGGYTFTWSSPASPLLLRVSATGYADAEKAVAPEKDQLLKLDFVLEEQKHGLEAVTVSSARPLLERKPDRVIFNVTGSVALIGGNALDAVKRAPGVLVNEQDATIRLIGKSMVQVLIDDRLQQLSGDDLLAYLQGIPAGQVERIEIITSPPAKYDAAGNAGLINIVLKKNRKAGLNGNVRAGYEQATYGRGIAGADLAYRQASLDLAGNIQYSTGANQVGESLSTPYPAQRFDVTDDYRKTMKPLQYGLNAAYTFDNHHTAGLQFNANNMNRTDASNSSIRVLRLPSLLQDSTMLTRNNSIRKGSTYTLNAHYSWNADSSGKKLELNANRLWFRGRRSSDFTTTRYSDDFITPTGAATFNESDGAQFINITTVQADLELPLQAFALSFGGKLSFIDNRSDNHFRYFENGSYYEDPSISNAFDYKEKVQALYTSTSRTWGKWDLQAGLRGEYTQTRGFSRNLNQVNTNRYFNLFPTVFIQFNQSADHVWNIAYSKRINRPDYRSLDPFRAYATPYHYGEGNPFLLPSFNHNAELNYTYKGRYNASLFYQYEQNHFGSVWLNDPVRNVTSGVSMNFADFMAWGVNLMGSLQPLKGWDMQLFLSGQMQQLRSSAYTATEQSYKIPVGYASVNSSFTLNREQTLLAELNMYILGKFRDDFVEISPLGSIDAGLKALFFQKRLIAGLNASDLLATMRARGAHVVTGQTVNNYFDNRNVRLLLQYKIGKRLPKESAGRKTGIEEEQDRAR